MDAASSKVKGRGTIRLVVSAQFKGLHLWWYEGCVCAYGTGSLHFWKDGINAEKYLQDSEQHMLPSRLFQERPCIFHQDNAKTHTAFFKTAWLYSRSPGAGLTCLKFRTFTNWKQLENHEMQITTKKRQVCWIARILHQIRVVNHSSPIDPATGLVSPQTFTDCC